MLPVNPLLSKRTKKFTNITKKDFSNFIHNAYKFKHKDAIKLKIQLIEHHYTIFQVREISIINF